MALQENEKKDKNRAIIVSTIVHGTLLLLVIFLIAWRAPNPPNPEFGFELNFGMQNSGNGEIQPEAIQDKPAEQTATETSQEVVEDASESTPVETDNSEATQEPTEEAAEDVQEPNTEVVQEVSPIESPDVVEEATNSAEKPVEEVISEPVEEKKPKETTEKETETATSTENEEETDSPSNTNKNADIDNREVGNGDKSTEGDQGDPNGKVEEEALYGNPGSSNGSSLELAGWQWDDEPEPEDTSIESGKIVFQITIDDEGYLTKIVTIEKTVTPAVEQVYRRAVEDLTFSKKSDYKPAAFSKGTITFIIKAN